LPPGRYVRNVEKDSDSYHLISVRDPITGRYTDPATLTIRVAPPTGSPTLTQYNPAVPDAIWTKYSKGNYQAKVTLSQVGTYKIKIQTTTPLSTEISHIEVVDRS
jgi:hypothetical protein